MSKPFRFQVQRGPMHNNWTVIRYDKADNSLTMFETDTEAKANDWLHAYLSLPTNQSEVV